MKKTALALTIVSGLIVSSVVGTRIVDMVEANPLLDGPLYPGNPLAFDPPTIYLPENNKTYNTNMIPLDIVAGGDQLFLECYYRVDDGPKNSIDLFHFTGELNLTDGKHTMTVTTTSVGRKGCTRVTFNIRTPPVVSVLSLENQTYDTSEVALNFTLNKRVTGIAYCLDGQENVTIEGNTTLHGLSNGAHNIVVYAWNGWPRSSMVSGASETVYFTIAKPEPFPTALAIVSLEVLAGTGVIGLLLYFKKRHRNKKQ